jgi:RNase P/RNase MRP subunit POP5
MKPLLPSLKERKRYILIRISGNIEKKDEVAELVAKAGLQFLGEFEMAKAGIQFLSETWNKKEKTGIIRVGHKHTDALRAALALTKPKIECLKVSGSLKKLKGGN